MKIQLINLVAFFLTTLSLSAQQKFTVEGKLDGQKEERKIFMSWTNDGKLVRDSAITKNGVFRFEGSCDEPQKVTLESKDINHYLEPVNIDKIMFRDAQAFFLEPGQNKVTGKDIKTASIQAGQAQMDYARLLKLQEPHQKMMDEAQSLYVPAYKAKDSAAMDILIPKMRAIRSEMSKIEEQFIRDNGNTYVALDLLKSRAGSTLNLQTFMPLYSHLSDEMKETNIGAYLAKKIETARKAAVGQPIENFKLPNLEGQMVEVASLKGKYVLVDFWASWCGPCRAENPFLKEAYAKYKPQNFEIVGISLDDKREKWVAAIEKDGLPWIHVSDLKGWKSAAALSYGITAIPQNFLVDANGVIVAQNLRGEKLIEKLNEIIK